MSSSETKFSSELIQSILDKKGQGSTKAYHDDVCEDRLDVGDSGASLVSNLEAKKPYVKVLAPMVRYTKLPFRLLCKEYDCDLMYTPMIVAETFNRSKSARDSEFSTNSLDTPLVAQFAANDPIEMGMAAKKVEDYVKAVDINCGVYPLLVKDLPCVFFVRAVCLCVCLKLSVP